MTQTGVIATDLPSFPWNPGDPLNAVPLNNQFFVLQGQIDNLTSQVNLLEQEKGFGNIGFNMTINWGGGTIVTPGPYELIGVAPYEFTLIGADFDVGDSGGSFTYTVLNNTSAVAGLSNVVVDQTTITHAVATSNQVVKKGSELSLLVTSVTGTPTNAWISIGGTTNVIIEPSLGVTTGSASGVSMALASGFTAQSGQMIAVSTGGSTTTAIGFASFKGVGLAQGLATGQAHGQQIAIGNITGTATGTSTASATGSSFTGFPTFVMDDPVTGVLNQNPLD